MSGIKIDIERSGFPVKIGEIELWFDTSIENLKTFFNIEEKLKERLKKAEEKAKNMEIPNEVKPEDVNTIGEEVIDAVFDYNKEFVKAQYDIIFGDGTFDKIYKKYPDIAQLERIINVLGVEIAKKIEEEEKERSKLVEKRKNEYLNKKAQKKK